MKHEGDFTLAQRKQMCLSEETFNESRMTVIIKHLCRET